MSDILNLLLLAANSVDTIDSRASDEIQAIDRAIQRALLRDQFGIKKEPALRVSDIGPSLLKHNPDVLHIAGHSRKTEGWILENDRGHKAEVQCAQLKNVLLGADTNLQLAFLSFCHSAACAREISTEIDFALGIEGKITAESALVFAPAFYEALASGKSVQKAVEYGKSILGFENSSEADRIKLHVRDGADASKPLPKLTPPADELKLIFERIVRGAESEIDRASLRRAKNNGVLLLVQQESETSERAEDVSFTENSGILQATLAPDLYLKVTRTLYPVPPGIAPPPPPRVFIGREDALQEVRRLLILNRRGDRENVTVVRGWPGVGKTSLVSAIGHDLEIIKTFKDGILWVSLEQKPNVITEMAKWGRALGSEEILKAPTVKDSTAQLGALLRGRRMLLIVDDVWETGHATAFTDAAGEQCSVMVTTRLPKVAEALTTGENSIYTLPVLTEDFALTVLRSLIPEVVEQNENECLELVRDLQCLPLALHVAAGLLRSEAKLGWGVTDLIKKIREGTELINKEAPKDRMEKDGVIPTVKALLQRSTDVLDEPIRDCFIYLGTFAPKPASFNLAALRAVWEVEDPRDIVRQLVGHGLLEPAPDGRFQMHRILVDHAISLGNEA